MTMETKLEQLEGAAEEAPRGSTEGVITRRRAALLGRRPTASTRACGARVNHRSAVRPGDDSFTAPELAATRLRRTMTAAHAASLILNKCFKVQTPAARNARAGRGGGERESRGGQGRGGQGWSPTRPPRRAVAHSSHETGEKARAPAPRVPSRRCSVVVGPLQEAASVTNCVSFFKHRALSLSSPGAATVGPGPRAALAGASRGRIKFPGTLPSPARPSRATHTRALAWATWDPRLRAAPAAR
ncbi:hypothetical protein ACRRTK_011755 [Alexandromys fortis]